MTEPAHYFAGTRSVSRKLALQALYRWQLNESPWQDLVAEFSNAEDMAQAANTLAKVGGGVVVVREGKQTALVELPSAGLMSAERVESVARKSARMVEAMQECGCTLNNAYMQLSLLALVVIPELRISDLGLVDVTQFKHIPVVETA